MKNLRYSNEIHKWSVMEISVNGPEAGNPFTDVNIYGEFACKCESVQVDGFYDGNGIYKVRFMPSFEGAYTFRITMDCQVGQWMGSFNVLPPLAGNHGPVRVANTFHFAYEDGTPYYPLGTTCYVWELQKDELIEQTFETLENSAFNKIRFCIFPKHYDYNLNEPRSYPYEGTPMNSAVLDSDNFMNYDAFSEGNQWDFTRFNPEYFRHIEGCIQRLEHMGLEADLIIMHPYDRWGFSTMTAAEDDLYLKYIAARFAAYHNVWWSLANEYDLCPHKTLEDWERYAKLICEKDPYRHLRSIHNCKPFYDYNRPWVTHCCIQRQEYYKTAEYVTEWREKYQKPIVLDEIAYEGNIQHGWGNISGQEMVRRFWEAACRGGYGGHGETYMHASQILWWSHGGKLRGESHKRFKFLLNILKETPGLGLMPAGRNDEVRAVVEDTYARLNPVQDYYLIYYSFMQPAFRDYHFDDTTKFNLKVLDTWHMTTENRGIVSGSFRVELPGRPYMAIQLMRVMD